MAQGPASFQGPLSVNDLLGVWAGAVDESYSAPLAAAGLGGGFEAVQQMLAQFARVSLAVDNSLQAMYIQPHSAQTAPPAGGAQLATVQLTFTRTGYLDRPLVLGAGLVWVDEEQDDYSPSGPAPALTGRRYTLAADAVFFPGDRGPVTVTATAELPGAGYNNPLPGSISAVEQVGDGFYNQGAGVAVSVVTPAPSTFPVPALPANAVTLQTQNTPDTLIPEHVGQYLLFTAGANVGAAARLTSFAPPQPAAVSVQYPAGLGSSGRLEQAFAAEAFAFHGGVGVVGERVNFIDFFSVSSIGAGTLLGWRSGPVAGHAQMVVALDQGMTISAAHLALTQITAEGATSGFVATLGAVQASGAFAPEAPVEGVGAASWRVMSWATDWGLTCTNAASPAGGRIAMLDLLGAVERLVRRQPGEQDDAYRDRVWQVSDVVTPNAARRAVARAAGNLPWCLREVGTALLPGFYYDRVADEVGDFYDWGALLFEGTYHATVPFQNPMLYVRGLNVLARGTWGSYLDGTGTAHPIPGAGFTLVLSRDANRTAYPAITPQAGDQIVDAATGADLFTVASADANEWPGLRRFHGYLDYTDMRAMLAVGLPVLDAGDFGFAYDDHPRGAYDGAGYDDFYDGYAVAAAAFYLRVYNSVSAVLAAAVTLNLYQAQESCA